VTGDAGLEALDGRVVQTAVRVVVGPVQERGTVEARTALATRAVL